MKTFTAAIVFVVMVFIGGRSWGQNLVPNGSFEDTIACPYGGGEIYNAEGWSSYSNTPDYFNSCSNGWVKVPSNFAGFQDAKSGSAYAGQIFYYMPGANFREDIGIQLLQPLNIGQRYYASFWVVIAFKHSVRFGIATNNIGIRLSTVPFSSFPPVPIDNYCQIYSDLVITDTLNWTKISGSFVADSAYSYFIIGNFFDDSLTSRVILDSTAWYSYYYVDDIKFSTDSDFVNSIQKVNSDNSLSISPNPASSYITIVYSTEHNATLTITNAYGTAVKQLTLYPSFKNRMVYVDDLPEGIYLVTLHEGNKISSKKMIVQR